MTFEQFEGAFNYWVEGNGRFYSPCDSVHNMYTALLNNPEIKSYIIITKASNPDLAHNAGTIQWYWYEEEQYAVFIDNNELQFAIYSVIKKMRNLTIDELLQ
jgi:hypothetical protein